MAFRVTKPVLEQLVDQYNTAWTYGGRRMGAFKLRSYSQSPVLYSVVFTGEQRGYYPVTGMLTARDLYDLLLDEKNNGVFEAAEHLNKVGRRKLGHDY